MTVKANEVRVRNAVALTVAKPSRDSPQHLASNSMASPLLINAHSSKHKGVFFGGDAHQTNQCLCLFCNPYRVVLTDLSLVFPCRICCENMGGIGRRSDSECD